MTGSWRGAVSIVVAVAALAGCDATRDGPSGLPGASATAPEPPFEPAAVPASAQPLVDGLIANFVDGTSLVARVDAADAPCVARRWIGILDPAALEAAGVTGDALTTVRLEEIPELVPSPLDAVRARALVESFAACDVDYQGAVLASMRSSGAVDADQQACVADALPDTLLEDITFSVLVDPELDAELTAQYAAAVGPCIG